MRAPSWLVRNDGLPVFVAGQVWQSRRNSNVTILIVYTDTGMRPYCVREVFGPLDKEFVRFWTLAFDPRWGGFPGPDCLDRSEGLFGRERIPLLELDPPWRP